MRHPPPSPVVFGQTSQTTVVLAVLAGVFGSLDTALNIAFPDLSAHFDLGVSGLQWVVVCFVLAYGGSLLGAGQLGDRFGPDRVLAVGASSATLALIVCAVAPTFEIFLGGRVVQGVSTALVMASAPALITRNTADDSKGHAIGRFQTSAAVGLAVGPVVGGPLVQAGGWPAVFWFRVPLSLVLLVLSLRMLGHRRQAEHPPTDVAGGVLFTVVLTAGLLAINGGRTLGWTSPAVLGATVVAGGALWTLPRVARRTPHPLLDPGLLHEGDFMAANMLAITSNGAMFATWLLLPGLLVDQFGWGVLAAGCCLALSPAATAVIAPKAGRRADRGPSGPLVIGGLAAMAGSLAVLGLAGVMSDSRPVLRAVGIVVGLVGVGAGLGAFAVPNMKTIMGALPPNQQGVAGGLALLTRTAGIVAAVAASSALFDAIEPSGGYDAAFRTVFIVMAVVLAVASLLETLRLRRAAHRRPGSLRS